MTSVGAFSLHCEQTIKQFVIEQKHKDDGCSQYDNNNKKEIIPKVDDGRRCVRSNASTRQTHKYHHELYMHKKEQNDTDKRRPETCKSNLEVSSSSGVRQAIVAACACSFCRSRCCLFDTTHSLVIFKKKETSNRRNRTKRTCSSGPRSVDSWPIVLIAHLSSRHSTHTHTHTIVTICNACGGGGAHQRTRGCGSRNSGASCSTISVTLPI
jgi:hypothetical protein